MLARTRTGTGISTSRAMVPIREPFTAGLMESSKAVLLLMATMGRARGEPCPEPAGPGGAALLAVARLRRGALTPQSSERGVLGVVVAPRPRFGAVPARSARRSGRYARCYREST